MLVFFDETMYYLSIQEYFKNYRKDGIKDEFRNWIFNLALKRLLSSSLERLGTIAGPIRCRFRSLEVAVMAQVTREGCARMLQHQGSEPAVRVLVSFCSVCVYICVREKSTASAVEIIAKKQSFILLQKHLDSIPSFIIVCIFHECFEDHSYSFRYKKK